MGMEVEVEEWARPGPVERMLVILGRLGRLGGPSTFKFELEGCREEEEEDVDVGMAGGRGKDSISARSVVVLPAGEFVVTPSPILALGYNLCDVEDEDEAGRPSIGLAL